MDSTLTIPENFALHVHQEIEIQAPTAIVFQTILDQAGIWDDMAQFTPNGKSQNMKLEAWPGGRLFRDLGDNAGHLWGHVQVIKPPTLLEICGPMMMSYPAINHLTYRLKEKSGVTTLALTHRAFGELDPQHREGVNKGWNHILEIIKKRAEQKK